jgi:hypothetical protein
MRSISSQFVCISMKLVDGDSTFQGKPKEENSRYACNPVYWYNVLSPLKKKNSNGSIHLEEISRTPSPLQLHRDAV